MKTLPRKVTKAGLDALPEAVREFYTQSGEDWVLAAEDAVAAQKAAQSEREARERAETELGKLRDELKALEDRKDIDPKKYKELVDAAAKAEQKAAEDEKNIEKIKELAVKEATAPLTARIKDLEGSVATLTGEKTTLQSQLTDEVAFTDDTLIGDRLKGWIGQKVHPQLQGAFEALVRRDHKPLVKRDGKSRTPLFMKGDAEVAWDEFLKEAETADWAKPFLLSDTNGNGGGGSGAGGGGDSASKAAASSKKTVKVSEMGGHLEAIAKGEVEVVEG